MGQTLATECATKYNCCGESVQYERQIDTELQRNSSNRPKPLPSKLRPSIKTKPPKLKQSASKETCIDDVSAKEEDSRTEHSKSESYSDNSSRSSTNDDEYSKVCTYI